MRTWAVSNQKGGVGKTTTAVTLAGLLCARSQRVLLVDMDPHGSLTSYFGHDPDSLESSLYQLFMAAAGGPPATLEGLIRPTDFEGLALLPASTALATLDRQLGVREGMGRVLAGALNVLVDRYDHVFIDCPPVLGVLMVNALAACDRLIIPVQTEFLALKGLERIMHTLAMIMRARKLDIPYTIVPTLFDRRTRASIETLRALRERYSTHLWGGVIPVDTQFREASQAGKPLPLYLPQARGVQAYAALWESLMPSAAELPARRLG